MQPIGCKLLQTGERVAVRKWNVEPRSHSDDPAGEKSFVAAHESIGYCISGELEAGRRVAAGSQQRSRVGL